LDVAYHGDLATDRTSYGDVISAVLVVKLRFIANWIELGEVGEGSTK